MVHLDSSITTDSIWAEVFSSYHLFPDVSITLFISYLCFLSDPF